QLSAQSRCRSPHQTWNRKRISDAKTTLKIDQKDAKETKNGLCCLRFLLFDLSAQPTKRWTFTAIIPLPGLTTSCEDPIMRVCCLARFVLLFLAASAMPLVHQAVSEASVVGVV